MSINNDRPYFIISNIRMQEIIDKFRKDGKQEAIEYIKSKWQKKWYCVINYVHGANITARKLFDDDSKLWNKYHNTLLQSDILFPDWLSVQVLNLIYNLRFAKKLKRLESINWTDFIKFLLEWLSIDYDLKLVLYGTYTDIISKSADKFTQLGYDVVYFQDGYTEFDWEKLNLLYTKEQKKTDKIQNKSINSSQDDQKSQKSVSKGLENKWTSEVDKQVVVDKNKTQMRILIQWRTTISNPIQEFRSVDNIDKIRQYWFVIMNQSWTFDHSDFGGIEQRSPEIIQKLKLERLWRTAINPKKWIPKILANIKLIPLVIDKILFKKK